VTAAPPRATHPRAVVFGCAGPTLSAWERDFFRDADPWGFILFARNIRDPAQTAALTASLREAVGRDAPVMTDQEGGRVARLRAPHWRDWPDVGPFLAGLDDAAAVAATRLRHRLIGRELRAVGIDVNCAPVLDLRRPETHAFLRDRCLGDDPARVAACGRAARAGLADAGVAAVIKHMPGHGRATADSHAAPCVTDAGVAALTDEDFAPFRANADAAMAMTCHVRFTALDPERCATLSPVVIDRAIRGAIGFRGLLLTDDLDMGALGGALGGPVAGRAAAALAAGCDAVLHCSGVAADMQAVAAAAPRLAGESLARADHAARRPQPAAGSAAEDARALGALMGGRIDA